MALISSHRLSSYLVDYTAKAMRFSRRRSVPRRVLHVFTAWLRLRGAAAYSLLHGGLIPTTLQSCSEVHTRPHYLDSPTALQHRRCC